MNKLRWIGMGTLFVLLAACGGGGEAPPQTLTVPTFSVVGPVVNANRFGILAKALSLPAEALDPQGSVRFTDPDRFLHIPVVEIDDEVPADEDQFPVSLTALDLDAIRALQVPSDQTALAIGEGALRSADLLPGQGSPYVCEMTIAHGHFEAVDDAGGPLADVDVDTQLNGRFFLDGVPVIGPGASLKLAFGPDEKVTHASFALYEVEDAQPVEIMTRGEATAEGKAILQRLAGGGAANLSVDASLVYYAPPMDTKAVSMILPHYQIAGMLTLPSGAMVPTRTFLLPAARGNLEVELRATLTGRDVSAEAVVSGGTPPYAFSWNSSSTLAPRVLETPSITYEAGPGRGSPFSEILTLRVTDARGVVARDIALIEDVPPLSTDEPSGAREYGVAFVGESQGLSGSAGNAGGFRERMMRDDPTAISSFFFGDYLAFERDFKDPMFSGDDDRYIDDVDITFYTGHANGDLWTFPGTSDDGDLRYPEASFGEGDLEWLIVAACGPLQPTSSSLAWWERWGPAFKGLHLFLGYQNVTRDNEREGRLMAEALLRGETVANAWIQTAIDVQSPTELVAVMGAIGDGGIANLRDHWHGRGALGPDIRAPVGFWMLTSTC